MENQLKIIHEYIQKLDAIEPVFLFEQPKKAQEYETNEALASAFAKKEFRDHLKNLINRQIYIAATRSNDLNMVYFNAGRIAVLKELYRDMERAHGLLITKKK